MRQKRDQIVDPSRSAKLKNLPLKLWAVGYKQVSAHIFHSELLHVLARMGDPYSGINPNQLHYTSTPGPCFQPFNVISFQLPMALPTSADGMDFQHPPITGSANNDNKLSKMKSKKITKKRKRSCGICRLHVKG